MHYIQHPRKKAFNRYIKPTNKGRTGKKSHAENPLTGQNKFDKPIRRNTNVLVIFLQRSEKSIFRMVSNGFHIKVREHIV